LQVGVTSDRSGGAKSPFDEVTISAIYSLVPTTPKGYGMIFIYSIELSKKKTETAFFPEAL
jgi:hypothetical protein